MRYLPMKLSDAGAAFTGGAAGAIVPGSPTPPALPVAPINRDQFAAAVLAGIGLTPTTNRMNFMRAWMQSENTKAQNNPLATTWNYTAQGSTFFNCLKKDAAGACIVGVQNFPTNNMGIEATIKTLKLSYYDAIRDTLQKDTNKINGNDPGLEKSFNTWGTTFDLFKKVYPQFGGKVTSSAGIGSYLIRGAFVLGGLYIISQAFKED